MKRSLLFSILTILGVISVGVSGVTQAQEHKQSDSPMHKETPGHSKEMGHSGQMNMSMVQDLGPADANYDLRFLNAMLEHHNGALTMAKDAAAKSKRPEIKRLANKIIKDQQKEITLMQTYRQDWYKQEQ